MLNASNNGGSQGGGSRRFADRTVSFRQKEGYVAPTLSMSLSPQPHDWDKTLRDGSRPNSSMFERMGQHMLSLLKSP